MTLWTDTTGSRVRHANTDDEQTYLSMRIWGDPKAPAHKIISRRACAVYRCIACRESLASKSTPVARTLLPESVNSIRVTSVFVQILRCDFLCWVSLEERNALYVESRSALLSTMWSVDPVHAAGADGELRSGVSFMPALLKARTMLRGI